MRVIWLATRNAGKVRELMPLLSAFPADWRPMPEIALPPETGATFEENATLKALAVARATGEWALADDSGLEVDALGGKPGVHSARWAGNDAANNAKLTAELAAVPDERRTARYRAVVVLASPDGVLVKAEGTCEGRIARAPRGTGGFGYDPYFLLPDRGLTMAELPIEEKNTLSHRGRAVRALVDEIRRRGLT